MVIIEYYVFLNLKVNFTGVTYEPYKIFRKNNTYHRYYGPAKIWYNGEKSWWFNHKLYGHFDYDLNYKYSQKQFVKDLGKQWLL